MIIFVTNKEVEMGMRTRLITDELYEKASKSLCKMSEVNRVSMRLKAIVAAKEHGVNLVSKIFNITSNTLRNWVNSFARDGEEGLMYEKGRGRKGKILEVHRNAILTWIEHDCNITLDKIVFRLKEQFGLESSKSAVHRVLSDLNLSYITPRPKHYKQDVTQQVEFKKKSK